MDKAFETHGQTLQKKIVALANPVQISTATERGFNSCDLEAITLNSPEEMKSYLQSVKDEYTSGDQTFYQNEETYNELKERNLFWLQSLKKLEDKNVFIAAGVSHLFGPTGLFKLLEENQFQVQFLLQTAEVLVSEFAPMKCSLLTFVETFVYSHEYWTTMTTGNLNLGLHWTEGAEVPSTPRDSHGQEAGGTLTLLSDDIAGDRKKIESAGGKILGETDQPWGHMLVFEDLDGNVLKLMKPRR